MAIWNLGSINIDHVYRLPRLPAPGETLTATGLELGLGGKGANQSVAAARAGAQVRHVGALGQGAADDWVIDRLAAAGVDCAAVDRLAGVPSGHAIILLDEAAENVIVVHPGANARLDGGRVAAALAGMGPSDTLLLQNETTLQVEAAAQARKLGARVVYSATPFDAQALRAILPHVSILALNEHEAAALETDLGGTPPVPAMLVTRGARGAEFQDFASGQVIRQAAFPVRPVDTTGAGDCFAGWFAAGLDRGESPAVALRHAAAAAAIQVTRPGAGDAMPDRAEVEAFLASC